MVLTLKGLLQKYFFAVCILHAGLRLPGINGVWEVHSYRSGPHLCLQNFLCPNTWVVGLRDQIGVPRGWDQSGCKIQVVTLGGQYALRYFRDIAVQASAQARWPRDSALTGGASQQLPTFHMHVRIASALLDNPSARSVSDATSAEQTISPRIIWPKKQAAWALHKNKAKDDK
ncbi:MAG: hypothetical protein ONB48_11455 [candidate division KSB1 bacterium]|nr:hypothetical protein [candidate division KSB1 bacterium]MDZ7275430.1 hypothetical protein [candidate division KSB1 bacterium]MDZ7286258.1 hypothetical protein [candidate division KSB1 bacterium]MDZ7296484.1 hypothetical protein [candidate division KSB1 bacterium]MDZ7347351.1 hypothetical protein [candidate division KSB1 bacterium]